ncbi:MAG: hypothetical protein IJ594_01380, partial [Oscillospiraceae bacterium]|nr:hypothetical protein [Oscillospiraceae bacterium]
MKRLLAAALAALLLLGLLPAAAFAAEDGVAISTAEEFLAFADRCALESYSAGETFSLKADIDLSNTGFTGVPYFAGTFLGNRHAILGLQLTGDGSRQGLFRQLSEDALVQDLNVKGVVTPGGTRCFVGGLAGVNCGRITGCSFEGSVAGIDDVGGLVGENATGGLIENCSFRGDAAGEHRVGGVAGVNRGQITGCLNAGAVNTVEIVPSGESSFDLASLTVDDFLDLADIGGIAGENAGTLLNCSSRGDVGYRYTGYNVGGVAGKTSGHIRGCSSIGSVKGRRDVGGVAGQLIPYAAWDLSEGRLDDLAAEIGTMNGLLAAANRDAQNASLDIARELAQMNAYAENALAAIEALLQELQQGDLTGNIVIDYETGEILYEGGQGSASVGELSDALYSLYGESLLLAQALGDTAGVLADDIAGIGSQTTRIFNSLFTTVSGLQEAGGEIRDLSAAESYEHDTGAIASSSNYGAVEAENNAGGVAGSVAFELDFDREDQLRVSDYLLSNARQDVFAVLRDCGSYGEVTVKQDRAGCVVGNMDIGAVVNCVGLGTAAAENGDYVGGVAGDARGTISGCWARTVLSGGKYVGGIAGQGQDLLGCRAWTHIEKGSEYLGAVAGWADGRVESNLYASGRPAGVDDVSRSGQCTPVAAASLAAMEGAPEGFDKLTLRFVVEGETVETVELPFGGSVERLPEVANRGEQYWKWNDFDREHIYHSMTVEGRYYAPNTTIASAEDPPLFLVEGVFYEGQSLRAAAYPAPLPEDEVLAAYTLYVDGYDGALTVR